jgi:hypothetical protein
MYKRKLDAETLHVQSFPTWPVAAAPRGTVKGNEDTEYASCHFTDCRVDCPTHYFHQNTVCYIP